MLIHQRPSHITIDGVKYKVKIDACLDLCPPRGDDGYYEAWELERVEEAKEER